MARRVLIAEVSGERVRGRPRLDGWCEGGLGQERVDCEGCVTMCERYGRVKSSIAYVDGLVLRGHFFYYVLLDRSLAICSLGGYHLEMGGMSLHNAVLVNCKKGVTADIKASVSGKRA